MYNFVPAICTCWTPGDRDGWCGGDGYARMMRRQDPERRKKRGPMWRRGGSDASVLNKTSVVGVNIRTTSWDGQAHILQMSWVATWCWKKNWCVKTFGQIFLELPIARGLESQILPDGVSRLYNFFLHTLGQVKKGVAAHQTNSTRPGLTIFFNSTRLNISRFLKNQNKRTNPGPGGY